MSLKSVANICQFLSTQVPLFSSRQEPPEAIGKCLFSLLSACFRGGATRSFPYFGCSPAPHRTGQAAFPHPAFRFIIQCASALRHGSRSLRIYGRGHFTQIKAWLDLPGVNPALAFSVEPFKQDLPRAIDVIGIPFCIIRYCVIAQMAAHSASGCPQHFVLAHYATCSSAPVCKLTERFAQFLAVRAPLHLEVPSPGLSAVMRKTQKSELRRLTPRLFAVCRANRRNFITRVFSSDTCSPNPSSRSSRRSRKFRASL